jgi:hypothetical protein
MTDEGGLTEERGALADIRTLVTSCVSQSVDGKFKKTCKAVLDRSLQVDHKKPEWFAHEWEQEIYSNNQRKVM